MRTNQKSNVPEWMPSFWLWLLRQEIFGTNQKSASLGPLAQKYTCYALLSSSRAPCRVVSQSRDILAGAGLYVRVRLIIINYSKRYSLSAFQHWLKKAHKKPIQYVKINVWIEEGGVFIKIMLKIGSSVVERQWKPTFNLSWSRSRRKKTPELGPTKKNYRHR